jgi:hypothetical protein
MTSCFKGYTTRNGPILLSEAMIGIVWNPTTPSHAAALPAIKAAGKKLGVALQIEPVSRIEELEAAFVI